MTLIDGGQIPDYLQQANQKALERRAEFVSEREAMTAKEALHMHNKLKHHFPYFGLVNCPVGKNAPVLFSVNDDVVAWNCFWLGSYERELMDVWDEMTQEGGHALDIGAYSGLYSLVAAMNGCTVDAFEIVPRTAERMKINLRLNNVLDKVHLHSHGLSSDDRQVDLFMPRSVDFLGTGNAIDEKANVATKSKTIAHVRSFKDCVADYDIPPFSAVKIDVEGHELEVLQGMYDQIAANRPKIIVEILERCMPQVNDFFRDLGYRMEQLRGHNYLATP